MKLTSVAYAAMIAATAALVTLASATPGEAKGKKKAEAAPVSRAFCFTSHKPVCATKGGMKFTYANSCYAVNDGAKIVSGKACPAKKAMKAKKGKKKAAAKPKAKKGGKKK